MLLAESRIQLFDPPPRDGEEGFRPEEFARQPPFRHVVSLGTLCYTAALLDRLKLRHFTGPFDWIFSSPAMVRHCIADGFRTFADPEQLEPIPPELRADPQHERCDHRFYRQGFGVRGTIFNHHDVWTPEGHAQLCRAVERFMRIAGGPDPALMLQFAAAPLREAVADFAETVATLSDHAPSGTLLAVLVPSRRSRALFPEFRLLAKAGRHMLIEMRPIGSWAALQFERPVDELALKRLIGSCGIAAAAEGA